MYKCLLYSMTLSKIIYPGMLMTYNCMEIAFQPTECGKKYVIGECWMRDLIDAWILRLLLLTFIGRENLTINKPELSDYLVDQ